MALNHLSHHCQPVQTLLRAAMIAFIVVAIQVDVATAARARTVLGYWAFNCFTTCGTSNFDPEAISQSTATMSSTFEPDPGVNESGTTLNAVPPYEARSALTLRTGAGGVNNGRNLTWLVNASGYTNLSVSFAVRRSAAGFTSGQFQYMLDGVTFQDHGAPFDLTTDFTILSFDLKRIRGLNRNPGAGFRIVWQGGSTTSEGEYALIDNLQVTGNAR
jgi:hypothetical protein